MSPAVRNPVHPRALRTRSLLLEAAEQEFSRAGYAGATARSIAERAGVATGSFYQYFADKDALLRELAASRQSALTEQLLALYGDGGSPGASSDALAQRLSRMIALVLAYHREQPQLHAVISERRLVDPALAGLIAHGERKLIHALAANLARQAGVTDPLATAFVLFGMVEGAVHAHVLGEPMMNDPRLVAALVEAALRVAFPKSASRVLRNVQTLSEVPPPRATARKG